MGSLSLPSVVELKQNNGCKGYWINRKWLSLSKVKELIKEEQKTVDVSDVQWYVQLNLDYVFNLKN